MKINKVPYASAKRLKVDLKIEECVWSVVMQPGGFDSVGVRPNRRKMQIVCISGPLQGCKLWIDWETEVEVL